MSHSGERLCFHWMMAALSPATVEKWCMWLLFLFFFFFSSNCQAWSVLIRGRKTNGNQNTYAYSYFNFHCLSSCQRLVKFSLQKRRSILLHALVLVFLYLHFILPWSSLYLLAVFFMKYGLIAITLLVLKWSLGTLMNCCKCTSMLCILQ